MKHLVDQVKRSPRPVDGRIVGPNLPGRHSPEQLPPVGNGHDIPVAARLPAGFEFREGVFQPPEQAFVTRRPVHQRQPRQIVSHESAAQGPDTPDILGFPSGIGLSFRSQPGFNPEKVKQRIGLQPEQIIPSLLLQFQERSRE